VRDPDATRRHRRRRHQGAASDRERTRIHHEAAAALPTRRELIYFGVWVALGLCVLAMIGLQMWTRWVWARGSL